MLCRIFQKSGLGPPNGDRYAPFVEEEWDEDAVVVVPGGDTEDDVANGDEARVECPDLDQVCFFSRCLLVCFLFRICITVIGFVVCSIFL